MNPPTKQPSGYPQENTPAAPVAGHTPFPFSVGFPLVLRDRPDSICICGANRGEGWPILCEVPKDTHHEKDADSIRKACEAYLSHAAHLARIAELEGALKDLIVAAESFDDSTMRESHALQVARTALAQSSSPKGANRNP